jgi:3-oxoacyl-[acyl-carrier protein] reductase
VPSDGCLSGNVALVTGGERGIGKAIVEGLARAGASVVINHLTQADQALAIAENIERAGGQAMVVYGDVSRQSDVTNVVEQAVRRFGTVDVLVNNAAMTNVHKPWYSITEEEWDRVLAVNLKSCFLCAGAVYPHMKKVGAGRIVNISSVTAGLGQTHLLHYASSKAAIIGFTRSLARELGPDQITVNAIAPGAIRTEAELEMFPDQAQLEARQNEVQALKRRGVPEDIVGAVVFLASDDSSFVTGQTLVVDGGWLMH